MSLLIWSNIFPVLFYLQKLLRSLTFLFFLPFWLSGGLLCAQYRLYPPEGGLILPYTRSMDTVTIMKQIGIWEKKIYAYPDSARLQFQYLFEASRQIGFYEGMLLTKTRMGICFIELDNYARAHAMYREAFGYQEKIKSNRPGIIVSLYCGMAYLFDLSGKYDSSCSYLYEGLRLLSRDPEKNQYYIALVYNNFAKYYLSVSDLDKASFYLEKGLSIALQEKNRDLLARFYQKKCILLFRQKRMDSARMYYRWATETNDNPDELQTADFLTIWGAMLHSEQRYQEALKSYNMALKIRQRLHKKRDVLRSYQSLATLYYHAKDYPMATFYIRQTIEGWQGESIRINYLRALEKGVNLYAAMGQYREAYKLVTEGYIPVKDSLFSLDVSKNISELDIRYKTLEKDKQIAETRLLLSKQESQLREKNFWIRSIAAGSLLLSAFLYSVFRSSRRKKHLQTKQLQLLQQEQQIDQLRAVMQGEEQERARLARDLHDGVGGMLAAIKMNVSVVQQEHNSESKSKGLQEVMQLVEGTADEVRKTAHNLMPDILHKHNLPQALRMYCDSLNTGRELQIDLQFHSPWVAVSPDFELSLYRILQELIQNVLKHAHARHMVIQFREQHETLHIIVEDDGSGFDENKIVAGLGLQNIRSRVAALQGHVAIESALGRGTTCSIELPLEHSAKGTNCTN